MKAARRRKRANMRPKERPATNHGKQDPLQWNGQEARVDKSKTAVAASTHQLSPENMPLRGRSGKRSSLLRHIYIYIYMGCFQFENGNGIASTSKDATSSPWHYY